MRNPFAEKNPSESGKYQNEMAFLLLSGPKKIDKFSLRDDNKDNKTV